MATTQVETTLQNVFGFDTLRKGQDAVISRILAGQSAAAIFPTGAGKSLCYQLPAMLLPGITLVVSPLLSLMHDQLGFLHSRDIPAASLDSTLSRGEYADVLSRAKEGSLKILMISVERFRNERFRNHLQKMNVSLLVVDEAHCISEWGHNFRPEYLKLPRHRDDFAISRVLLLTATATEEVAADMCQKLNVPVENCIRTGFYRENLHITVLPVAQEHKMDLLKKRLQDSSGSTIVYVTLQHTAEETAARLQQAGFSAQAYHAGKKHADRQKIQKLFMDGQIQIITATIAFGMGIDKKDIRRIIHFDLPKSIENYSQEIGRAGRDGTFSRCDLFACGDGVHVLENFIYGDTPDRDSIAVVLRQLADAGTLWEVQNHTLSRDSNIRILPLKTLLVYLELEGILTPKHTYFGAYRFKSDLSGAEILSRFSGEPRQFLKELFTYAQKKRTWVSLDLDRFSEETGAQRSRAVSALEYCDNANLLELSASRAIDVYRIHHAHIDIDALARKMADLFAAKETREVARITGMISFFEQNRCLCRDLAGYFGQNLAQDCGHCSVCDGAPVKMIHSPRPPLEPGFVKDALKRFRAAAGKEATVSTGARFLCGITMPMGKPLRLKSMNGFGSCSSVPYSEVVRTVRNVMV
ncbi:MAG: RecQ family ATP-dependent DNA helicase [Fibrobacterota bacterium]